MITDIVRRRDKGLVGKKGSIKEVFQDGIGVVQLGRREYLAQITPNLMKGEDIIVTSMYGKRGCVVVDKSMKGSEEKGWDGEILRNGK